MPVPLRRLGSPTTAGLENAPECQDGVVLPGTKASTSWMDGQSRKNDSDEAGALMVVEPELMLELQASRPFAAEEDHVSYLLSVCHSQESHAPAYDVDLENLLPEGITYDPGSLEVLSGPAASTSESGQGPKWHFDSIDPGWNSSRKILLRFNASSRASPGTEIVSHARITWTSLAGISPDERTGDGGLNDYLRSASANISVMSLSIRKSAQPDPVGVGEPLSYTLTYENAGSSSGAQCYHQGRTGPARDLPLRRSGSIEDNANAQTPIPIPSPGISPSSFPMGRIVLPSKFA